MKKIYLLASLILIFGLTACTSVTPEQPKVDSAKANIEKEVKKEITEADAVENDSLDQVEVQENDLAGWRDFTTKIIPVEMKYHKNWYYAQYKGPSSENYRAYFGFSPNPKDLEVEDITSPQFYFPIEFEVLEKSKNEATYELVKNSMHYQEKIDFTLGPLPGFKAYGENEEWKNVTIVAEKDDVLYVLRIVDLDKNPYEEIMDNMALTFQFVE